MGDRKKGGLPTKLSWYLRMLVGAYLLFLDYQILRDSMNGGEPLRPLVILFMVLFAASGVTLIAWGIRGLVRGEYIGGSMDAGNTKDKIEQEEGSVYEETDQSEEQKKD